MNPNRRKYDAVKLMGFGRSQSFPSGPVQEGRVAVRLGGQSLRQVVAVLRSWGYRITCVDTMLPEELDSVSRRGMWIIRPSIAGSESHPLGTQRENFLGFSESITHPALLLTAIACHHRAVGTNLIGEKYVVHTGQLVSKEVRPLLVQFIHERTEFVLSKRSETLNAGSIRISGATRIMR